MPLQAGAAFAGFPAALLLCLVGARPAAAGSIACVPGAELVRRRPPALEPGRRWYFAFGSNMNPERMVARGATYNHRVPGFLPGHSLSFDKPGQEGGYATISSAGDVSTDAGVHGVLYDLDEASFRRLDVYEGVDKHYVRQEVQVSIFATLRDGPAEEGGCSAVETEGEAVAGACSATSGAGAEPEAVHAIAYVASPTQPRDSRPPSEGYLLHLLGGADLLPEDCVEQLRQLRGGGRGSGRRLSAKYFFVYGTLRPDGDGAWTGRFNRGVTAHPAWLPNAELFHDAIGYAAVVLGQQLEAEEVAALGEDGGVFGYLLTATDDALRRKLTEADRIEGYPDLYKRSTRYAVMRDTGKIVKAFVYHRPDSSRARPVPSRDWYHPDAVEARGGKR